MNDIIRSAGLRKVAGWYTSWLEYLSDRYRRSIGLKPIDRSHSIPTPGVYRINGPKAGKDELVGAAQGVVDAYKASDGYASYYHNGKSVTN